MRVFELGSLPGRDIDRFGSRGAHHAASARTRGDAVIVCLRVNAGGLLGRHLAAHARLFCVVAGSGWVSGSDGQRTPIRAAQRRSSGETHESVSHEGMSVRAVEGCSPDVHAGR